MLFAVAERLAAGRYLADVEGLRALQFYLKGHHGRLAGLHAEGLALLQYHLLRFGVQQAQHGRAADAVVSNVEDACRELCLVALAQESRHVGLHHDLLLCHGFAFYVAVLHVLRGGYAHESPCGEALGQGELNGNAPVGVGCQCGVEEGRFVQVLAHLHGLSVGCRLVVVVVVSVGSFFSSHFLHHGMFFQHHRGSISIKHDIATPPAGSSCHGISHHDGGFVVIVPKIRKVQHAVRQEVEVAEAHALDRQRLPVVTGAGPQPAPRREAPAGRWRGDIHVGGEGPVVTVELVERLVVHGGHELCVGRCAVGVGHHEFPLFFLSGCQPVAEGFPAHVQLLVGQRALDGGLVAIYLAVLDPCKGEQQAVAVLLAVGELTVPEGIRLVEGSALYHLVAGKDAIDGVYVLVAGAYLHGDGLAVGSKL